MVVARYHVGPPADIESVDATGTGDAFNSGACPSFSLFLPTRNQSCSSCMTIVSTSHVFVCLFFFCFFSPLAGFLFKYTEEGATLLQAVQFGSICGAYRATVPGANARLAAFVSKASMHACIASLYSALFSFLFFFLFFYPDMKMHCASFHPSLTCLHFFFFFFFFLPADSYIQQQQVQPHDRVCGGSPDQLSACARSRAPVAGAGGGGGGRRKSE